MTSNSFSQAGALAGRPQKPEVEIQTDELELPPDFSVVAADELRVRNTFIDAGPSPSMERFLRERVAMSCPGSRVGQLADTFSASACTKNLLRAPCASKPAVISLVDALADLPTMPSTPEPLSECWQPFAQDGSIMSCLQQPTAFEVNGQAILMQHGGHAAALQQLSIVIAPLQAQAPGWSPEGISLPAALNQPTPGSDGLPNLGSAGHALGDCKPCAFLHSKSGQGCSSGALCKFCHLCAPGEKKRRQKERKQDLRQAVLSR